MKTLYIVVAILLISLLLFFLGTTEYSDTHTFSLATVEKGDMSQFFLVFAIIFPAFTGMTAGVGLSGDLKKPSKSIPLGTVLATVTGMIVYCVQTDSINRSGNPQGSFQSAGHGGHRPGRGNYHTPWTGSLHILFGHRLNYCSTPYPSGTGRRCFLPFKTVQPFH